MKTSLVVLIPSLFYLCVAEVQQLGQQAEEDNGTNVERASVCYGDMTGSQKYCQLVVTLRELEARLRNTEKQLEDLRGELNKINIMITSSSHVTLQGNRVAFGASIGVGDNAGHFDTEITLIYKNVFTNTGAYNPATGVFTAPVKGVYYFTFTGHSHSAKAMGLQLMKNGAQMVTVVNHLAGTRWETATNSMTLQLEVGDRVSIRLMPNTWICDNDNNHVSTFNGHLLFLL
uniref:C1q domain-containing protein n=1 Tax=Sparus aurata TaxID=8175 RepID=A0A671Y1U2_SPAAU